MEQVLGPSGQMMDLGRIHLQRIDVDKEYHSHLLSQHIVHIKCTKSLRQIGEQIIAEGPTHLHFSIYGGFLH